MKKDQETLTVMSAVVSFSELSKFVKLLQPYNDFSKSGLTDWHTEAQAYENNLLATQIRIRLDECLLRFEIAIAHAKEIQSISLNALSGVILDVHEKTKEQDAKPQRYDFKPQGRDTVPDVCQVKHQVQDTKPERYHGNPQVGNDAQVDIGLCRAKFLGRDAGPEVAQTKSKVFDANPEECHGKPKVPDAKLEVSPIKLKVRVAEPKVCHAEPQVRDAKLEIYPAKSQVRDVMPEVCHANPQVPDAKPPGCDIERTARDATSKPSDAKPQIPNSQPQKHDTKQKAKGTQPKARDAKLQERDSHSVKAVKPLVRDANSTLCTPGTAKLKECDPKLQVSNAKLDVVQAAKPKTCVTATQQTPETTSAKATRQKKENHCTNCRKMLEQAQTARPTDPSTCLRSVLNVVVCGQRANHGKPDLQVQALDTLVEKINASWEKSAELNIFKEFPPKFLQVLFDKLLGRIKWDEIKLLLDNVDESLALASRTQVTRYLLHEGLSHSLLQKSQMVSSLLGHGSPVPDATDPSTRTALKRLLDRHEDLVVIAMLEKGLHPLALSPQQDLKSGPFFPVHFAFQHCMAQEKGDFRLFDCLRSMRPTEKRDALGNTFLHHALKVRSSQQACKALSQLFDRKLFSFYWNTMNELAIDFLKDHEDKRIDMLIKEMTRKVSGLGKRELERAVKNCNNWFNGTVSPHEGREEEKMEEENVLEIEETCGGGEETSHVDTRSCGSGLEGPSMKTVRLEGSREARMKRALEPAKPTEGKAHTAQDYVMDAKPWRVVFEKRALELLMSKRCSDETRNKVFDIVSKLASGERRPKDKRMLKYKTKIHFYEANITPKQRLIWNTKLHSAPGKIGTIRIWDVVLDHDKIRQALDRIILAGKIKHQSTKPDVCLHRMELQRDLLGGYVVKEEGDPQVWQSQAELEGETYGPLKFCTLTTELILDLIQLEAADMEFPIDVKDDERDVIQLPEKNPILLQGRSGTGKTTCCLYRMWNTFKAYWTHPWSPFTGQGANDGTAHPLQMFVTKNPVLCGYMLRHFRRLCRGNVHISKTYCIVDVPPPRKLQDANSPEFRLPLMLTSRQLWLALDASLSPSYFPRRSDGSLLHPSSYTTDTAIGGSADYLLGNDFPQTRSQEAAQGPVHQKLVTYDVFVQEIWPCLGRPKFHPSVLWTEIVSSIKGSYEALKTSEGHLSLEEYLRLGREKAYICTADRNEVFSLFETYQRFLKRRMMYDEMDFIFSLHQRLNRFRGGSLPWLIHQVYVDETQDFTQAELYLLMRLTSSPNKMFLAGDTAQSVTRGVTFRFKDLTTLFYHADLKKPVRVPLSRNYRSHNGILPLASSVLDLLADLFPSSFDKLQPDQGDREGPKPEFLPSSTPAELVRLLSNSPRQTEPIEFGARQVILVVNENSLDAIPKQMKNANRLTIYESKGLEFDDVLIYNFFTDSQATFKEWKAALDSWTGKSRTTFDPDRHKILCSELKILYTAVTRARANVYFFDQDGEKRQPMFDYFKSRNLVCIQGENSARRMTSFTPKVSSSEAWERQGDLFFANGTYSQAVHCYRKSGAELKLLIAETYSRLQAIPNLEATSHESQLDYQKAALLFLDAYDKAKNGEERPEMLLHLVKMAAACLEKGDKSKMAACILERFKQFGLAAEMYSKVGCILEAERCRIATLQEGGSTHL